MGYQDCFEKPEVYLAVINRLLDRYTETGNIHAAADLRKQIDKLTDLPSLRMLANKCAFLHNKHLTRP